MSRHLTIEQQAIGTSIFPAHKFKDNFEEYFEEYIKLNKREGNRHLTCCLTKLQMTGYCLSNLTCGRILKKMMHLDSILYLILTILKIVSMPVAFTFR